MPRGVINGKKRCTGPCHPEGGEMLPLAAFYFHKSGKRAGKPHTRCSRCYLTSRTRPEIVEHGYVEAHRVRFVFVELESRLGVVESARRIGVTPETVRRILDQRRYVQRDTVRRAATALIEARNRNEVRPRRSDGKINWWRVAA